MSWILKDFTKSELVWGCLLLIEELFQAKTLSTDMGWFVHLIASQMWAGVESSLRNIVDAATRMVFGDM